MVAVIRGMRRLDRRREHALTVTLTRVAIQTARNRPTLHENPRLRDQLAFVHCATLGSVSDELFSYLVGLYYTGWGKTVAVVLVPRVLDIIWPLNGGHERIMLFLSPLKLYVVATVRALLPTSPLPHVHWLRNSRLFVTLLQRLDADRHRVITFELGGPSARSVQLTMDMKLDALEKTLLNFHVNRPLYILFPGKPGLWVEKN